MEKLRGKCYNISLDQKKILKGWLLLIADDGEEYLIRRNTKLSLQCFRKMYQTDYSFKQYALVRKRSFSASSSFGLVLGIGLARAFSGVLPMSLIFGETNRPASLGQGLINMFILIVSVGLSLVMVSMIRKWQMERFLGQNGARLVPCGRVKSTSYFQKFYNGIEVW